MSETGFHFFTREALEGKPAGMTVSRNKKLPAGDFPITEFCWPAGSLWFVDADEFTADEREIAYDHFLVLLGRRTGNE